MAPVTRRAPVAPAVAIITPTVTITIIVAIVVPVAAIAVTVVTRLEARETHWLLPVGVVGIAPRAQLVQSTRPC